MVCAVWATADATSSETAFQPSVVATEPAPTSTASYFWQVMVVDLAMVGAALATADYDDRYLGWNDPAGWALAGGYVLAPATVHFIHGRTDAGTFSMVARLIVPPIVGAAALLGVGIYREARYRGNWGNWLAPEEPPRPEWDKGRTFLIGGGVGIALAMTLDWVAAGADDYASRRKNSKPAVAPAVGVHPSGVVAGVEVTF